MLPNPTGQSSPPSDKDAATGTRAPAVHDNDAEVAPGVARDAPASTRPTRPALHMPPVRRVRQDTKAIRRESMPILAAFQLATRLHAGHQRADGEAWNDHLRQVIDDAVAAGVGRDELVAALLREALALGRATADELLAVGVPVTAIQFMQLSLVLRPVGDPPREQR